MNRKASAKFIIKRDSKDYFTGFKFLNKTIETLEDNHEFDIPIEVFKGTNNYVPSIIELYNKKEITMKKFLINLYICKNIFHLYLSRFGNTFELLFLEEPDFIGIKENINEYEFDENGNKHRFRISLINFTYSEIEIFNFIFSPLLYCPNLEKLKNEYKSYQLSIYSKSKIIGRINDHFNPHIDINGFYKKYNDLINKSYETLIEMIKNKNCDFDVLISIAKKQYEANNNFNKLELHKSKEELEIAFNDENYVEFFYKLLSHKLLLSDKSPIKNTKDFINAINKFDNFKKKLISDPDLKIYQKIFGLIQYNYTFMKYNYDNTYYIKVKDAKPNSILYNSILLIKEFISNLDEESPVFFKLLELNSKFGYYEGNPIYNFNLLNVQDIKEHITELIPEVIYFFDNNNTDTKAFVFSMTGEMSINKRYLFKKYKEMNLTNNFDEKDIKEADNISMTISRLILHEKFGHSKFRNKSGIKTGIKSPIKCVSEGKIKQLTHLSNKAESSNLIKILSRNKIGRGDSGHFLETAFGQLLGQFSITYFDRLKDVGKLLKFPDYFVKKEKLPVLQENLYFKCLIEKNKIPINIPDDFNLLMENYYMFSILKDEQKKKGLNEDKQILINQPEEIEDKKDNNSMHNLEESEYESSFTEEKYLKDINNDVNNSNNDSKEQTKSENIFLTKKRKLSSTEKKYDIKELKDINEIPQHFDFNAINKFKFEIEYDDYTESDDDEACT